MTLKIPGGFQLGKETGKLIARQDILKFGNFNLNIIEAAGVPRGQHEEGTLFFNGFDRKLYLAYDYKKGNTPDLLWYKFNDNAQDFSSGQKTNGTLAGSPVFVAGQHGNAITLDATDDKVTIVSAMGLDFAADWTFSYWIKLGGATWADGDKVYLLTRFKDANEYFEIYLQHDSGNASIKMKVRWNNGAGETIEQVTTVIDNGVDNWVYVHYSHDTSANIITGRIKDDSGEAGRDEAATLPAIAFTTEDFEIGFSNVDSSFGDQSVLIDSLKIFQEIKAQLQE